MLMQKELQLASDIITTEKQITAAKPGVLVYNSCIIKTTQQRDSETMTIK